jgi:hypothetical protein
MPPPRRRRSWAAAHGFRSDLELPPWREHRLPRATAAAVAAILTRAGLGRCAVFPGTKGWDVLVELGPVPGHGELVVLATLGDAAPLLGRAFRLTIERHGRDREAGPPSSAAERQIREALVDVLVSKAEVAGLLDDVREAHRALGLPEPRGLDAMREALEGEEEAEEEAKP